MTGRRKKESFSCDVSNGRCGSYLGERLPPSEFDPDLFLNTTSVKKINRNHILKLVVL